MDPGLLAELVEAFNEFESSPPGTGREATILTRPNGAQVVRVVDGGFEELLSPPEFQLLVLNL